MKAFTIYDKNKSGYIKLFNKLSKYGTCNCDIDTFIKIYHKWHQKSFPGTSVDSNTATFRPDWFQDFIKFISNYDI